jgi:trk system potassium uptake protein TrkA
MMVKRNQFVVIGLGGFGGSVAKTLAGLGYEVLAVDTDETTVQEFSNYVTHVVQADATNENALKALGVRNFDVAIISIGENIQASILATVLLKEMGIKTVITKAESEIHGKVLEKIGATRVIFPERDMGIRIAHGLASSNILEYLELDPDYSIVELTAPEWIIGKTLKEVALRNKYGINVVAIRKENSLNVSPGADDTVEKGDILIVIGENKKLAILESEK